MKTLLLLFASLAVEPQSDPQALANIRRIYVEQMGGGLMSDQMEDMIIAAIQSTGLFTITENRERADAVLKGSGDEKVFNEMHATSDSIGVRAGSSSASASGVRYSRTSERQSATAGVTESESSRTEEHRREASASVRLVNNEGDVIWSTTQESQGAKFRGSMADVADKIARKLSEETNRARMALRRAETPSQGQ